MCVNEHIKFIAMLLHIDSDLVGLKWGPETCIIKNIMLLKMNGTTSISTVGLWRIKLRHPMRVCY